MSKALARSLFDDLPQGAIDRAEPNALQQANIMNSTSEAVGSLWTSNIMNCDFSWVIPHHPVIVTQPPAKQGRICREWTDIHEQNTVSDWAVRLHNVCCKFGDEHTLPLSMGVVRATIKRKKTAFSRQVATVAFSHLSLQPMFSHRIPQHVHARAQELKDAHSFRESCDNFPIDFSTAAQLSPELYYPDSSLKGQRRATRSSRQNIQSFIPDWKQIRSKPAKFSQTLRWYELSLVGVLRSKFLKHSVKVWDERWMQEIRYCSIYTGYRET
jgi:hypothetical protein